MTVPPRPMGDGDFRVPPGRGPIEPSAAMRAAAKALREMYVAMLAEGFTQPEAMQIIGHAIAGSSPPR